MSTPQRELRWVQPKWNRRCYELKEGEAVVAQLEFRTWKSVPHIILDGGEELTIRSRNFWRTKTAIMRGADQEIALYQRRTGGKNELTFVSGRTFIWKRNSIWSSSYTFIAADNEELMKFKTVSRLARSEASVTLSPGSDKYPETRLLMAFGWYLMLAEAQAAAAAAT
jgi:hypothetical protein